MRMRALCISVLLAVGCGKPNTEQPAQAKPIVAPSVPEGMSTHAPIPKSAGLPAAATDLHTVLGNMGQEAANRPRAGVLAEPLFDALEEKANIKLPSRNQYMGASMHASFCAGGRTEATSASKPLTVAMCEYTDDAAAKASLDYMNSTFNMTNSRREVHKAAVLTIVATSADDPRVDAAFKVFENL
jgi:hypothetical protein